MIFLTVKYGIHSAHQYCKFCIFYSKPVIFLQETVFFYIKTVKQTKHRFL